MRRPRNRLQRSSSAPDEPKSSSNSVSTASKNSSLKWKFTSDDSKTSGSQTPNESELTVTLEQAYNELKSRSDAISTVALENYTPKIVRSSNSLSAPNTPLSNREGHPSAMSAAAVSKDESRKRKMLTRILSGIFMVSAFLLVLYLGHFYICAMIFLMEAALFQELVTVRYNTFFHIIENTIPLFRTTQWIWFLVAIFYAYGDFVVEVIKSNTSLHYLLAYAHFQVGFAFLLYSGVFILTITALQPDHIRFQLNQLCWTILVLCLTVGQLKYIMHNVYNGLFWFAFPIFLVVCNDSFAWLSGVTYGRKFIRREFIRLSPNKTWEGFIGGCIGTMLVSWYLSKVMAQYKWMTCPVNQFLLLPTSIDCEIDPIFQEAFIRVPSQLFELFPRALVQMLPGVVDICMVHGDPGNLTPCISGNPSHHHHHFEYIRKMYPVQIHALSLGLFASFVAPFGGFFASAIKRAYGIKDYGSLIPGHGGIMDRVDCQFLMALYTWVHYNTFIKMTTVSVPKMIYMYHLLKPNEQKEFLEKIVALKEL